MRGLSVPGPTSRARTPVTAVALRSFPHMHAAGLQHTVRMHRQGISRYLGGWAKAASSSVARQWGLVAGRAAATQAQGSAPDTPSADGAASSQHSGSSGPRVVLLGGGFGGLYAAVRLDQLMWPRGNKPQITLVDQSDRFVFKPLLYELLNGTATTEEVAPPLAQLLAPYPIRFVQAQAVAVQPSAASAPAPDGAGLVTLSDGTSLPYDYLLVALGSQPDSRGVPGVREYAVPFNTFEDAVRVKGTLDLLADSGAGGSVVIVGGGYAGVELAAVVGERLRGRGGGALTVRLLTPGSDILEGCPEGQRAAANQALAELGVQVLTGMRVQALGAPADNSDSLTALPTACTVTYSPVGASDLAAAAAAGEGPALQPPPPEQLAADLVIWTAGSSPATRGARVGFPFPTNERGAIVTEPSLRVKGSEVVFALGDVATAAPEAPSPSYGSEQQQQQQQQRPAGFPATAQVAFQEADYAAWNIWAAINKRPLLPFRYQHLGSMMSLGQINAAVSVPLDVPLPLADAVKSSPLGPLLSSVGVKLGEGGGGGVTLEGPLAAVLRRGAYLYRQPTNEQRMNVAASWLKMGLEAAAALAGGRVGR